MSLLVVSVAGAIGALSRYLLSGWVQRRHQALFPAGTLVVNLAGSFGLGLVVGGGQLDSTFTVMTAGFFGGFTTYSTWMIETIRLGLRSPRAVLNLTLGLAGGVLMAAGGYTLMS
jgi:CrcB protein